MTISKPTFDHLLDHMLDIHKRKINIASPYSADYDAYMTVLNFLNTYIRYIGDFLDTAVVSEDDCAIPFVIIGSLVYAEGAGICDRAIYSVVLPEEAKNADTDAQTKIHACLSPVSDAFLFKKIGDRVVFEEDGQIRHYTIKRIEYP